MRRWRSPPVLVLAMLVGIAGSARGDLVLEGATMGTRYAVRAGDTGAWTRAELTHAVEEVLERIDAALSTWRGDSELERFNRSRETRWMAVSPETARVAGAAHALAVRSQGAFDPTIGPLVRLWGFGAEPAAQIPPPPALAAAARSAVGFHLFHVRDRPSALRKDRAELELDLSGIAKGYAVDAVAARLREAGIRNFLVEIGGEIRALGDSPRGGPWRVEIEDPLPPARVESKASLPPARRPPATLALRDAAVATSGPTRNFVVEGGERRSHVFDPRTGAPLVTDLVSVSVIAASAMQADGWATALLVAGPERGWELAKHEQLAALFVTARDGGVQWRSTPGFDAHRTGWVSEEGRP